MKVLLIEDDRIVSKQISTGFKDNGHLVFAAHDGKKGLQLALNGLYDIAVIDLMLPHMGGAEIINIMRSTGIKKPVLVLSATRSIEEKISILRGGCDDFLAKPFAFSELLARVEALYRRIAENSDTTFIVVEDLSLDVIARHAERNGETIYLQEKEYALLEYLMKNTGQVVSRAMILERIWNYNFNPQTNVIEACICKLRVKIDSGREVQLIHTVKGAGYVMESRKN